MKKYFSFSGQATRSEYWAVILISMVALTAVVLAGVLMGLAGGIARSGGILVAGILFIFAAVVLDAWLFVATTVRRLRDADLNPWWTLATFIPYIGWIPAVVFGCLSSQKAAPAAA